MEETDTIIKELEEQFQLPEEEKRPPLIHIAKVGRATWYCGIRPHHGGVITNADFTSPCHSVVERSWTYCPGCGKQICPECRRISNY